MKRRFGQSGRLVKAGLAFAIAAILLIAIGVGTGTAQAEEHCLSAPNAQAPPGSRWYYHVDHTTQRHCWYLRGQGRGAATAPAAASKPSPDQPLAREPQRDATDQAELRESREQSDMPVGGVQRPVAFVWPVQSPTAPTDKMVSPDPSTSDHESTLVAHDTSSSTDLAARDRMDNAMDDVTQLMKEVQPTPVEDAKNEFGSVTAFDKELFIGPLFWLVTGLVLAGILAPLMRKVWLMS